MLLVLTGAACTQQSIRPDDPAEIALRGQYEPWSDELPTYRLGEGDRIKVRFPLTPEMDEDVLIRPDGVVSLQATGDVPVASLTPGAAADLISQAAQKRLKKPQVAVSVLDAASSRIFIGGEVKQPGAYPLTGPLTVVDALQVAGGAGDTARLSEVILLRRSPDNRAMLRLINVRAELEGREPRTIRLVQGDILYVPRTWIGEFDLWIDQFINKSLPFTRNFDYTTGNTTTTTTTH
jgi:protein involved in polysaccharide export with SLBB domain